MSGNSIGTQSDPLSLRERTIVVTGAGQGIGRGMSERAMQLGATVVAIDSNGEKLESFSKEATENGRGKHLVTFVGSVTDRDFIAYVLKESVERFGEIDGLVNNAGIVRAAMIDKMTFEQWQQVIDVNLTGVFNCLQIFGSHMVSRSKEGAKRNRAIVNISSVAGRRGTIGQINYGAAKSGVLGLTMCAAREWARYNVRVNSVCYGMVETPMTETIRSEKFRDQYLALIPLSRWSSVDEAALPISFLLSDAASYITGQHLSADGGFHIAA